MTATSATFRRADPADLDGLRALLESADGDRRLAPIDMRQIVIAPDALARLPQAVAGIRRGRDPIVVIQDTTPMARGSGDLKAEVAALLRSLDEPRIAVIGAAGEPLHADATALAAADAAIAGAGCVVAVGSGTITDIAKDASHRAGDLPYVVVQTAVSVNAFSDNMAVLLRDGVKRTVPSRWPDVLLVDAAVVAAAPPAMNRAGYGELASMFTAPADWYLASLVGADASYHPAAVALTRDSGDAYLAAAEGVRHGDAAATLELARVMTLSGITLGVAGRTAPLSGAEHLVSHLLDMAAASRGAATAFHGAQVGVASVLVALVWRAVLAELRPDRLATPAAHPSPDDMRRRVEAAFAWLDADGSAAAECWRDYGAKLASWAAQRGRVARLAEDWALHREVLAGLVVDPAVLADALQRAGAPTRFGELDPSVDAATARWALASGFLMRNRFTVADLAFFGGLWDDAFVDRILAEAAALGAGL